MYVCIMYIYMNPVSNWFRRITSSKSSAIKTAFIGKFQKNVQNIPHYCFVMVYAFKK